jgi:hypothetical protein
MAAGSRVMPVGLSLVLANIGIGNRATWLDSAQRV